MSKPIVLNYAATVTNLIANTQNVALGASLILNSGSPYAPIPSGPFYFSHMQRYITLSSTTATTNAGVTFVISGTALGSTTLVTENLTGPAGNATVTSANQYSSITSIVATVGAATAIEAGSGIGATFEWQTMDTYRQVAQFSIQGVITAGTVSYSVLQTLDNPQNPPATIAVFPVDNTIATPLTASTFYSFEYAVAGLSLYINPVGDGTNAAGALTFTILQQGVQ